MVAPLCGAIFYKRGAKRRILIPLDPCFFGKRGGPAGPGYSGPRPPSLVPRPSLPHKAGKVAPAGAG